MHHSKLFSLLKSINPSEIRWFLKFLKSPFYNKSELPIQLFQYLYKCDPKFNSPKLTKENAFAKLFPNEKYSSQKVRKIMHDLAELTEEYLIAMHIRTQSMHKKKLLVEALGERNLYEPFEKGTNDLIQSLNDLPYRDVAYFKDVHTLRLDFYGHIKTPKDKANMIQLKSSIEHLDFYYLLQRQRLDFTIKWHEKLMGNPLKIKSLKQAKPLLKKEPVFKLYELILTALSTSQNKQVYSEIERIFRKEIDALGKTDQLEIIRVLLNYWSGQINQGREEYQQKTLSLYQFGLKKNVLLQKGMIAETTFANIAALGILEKEYEWVENFIEEYRNKLPSDIQTDATSLSLGLLFFNQKEYQKTLDLILNQSFAHPLYIIKSKSILLRVYFEQFILDNSYSELLLDQSYAFEKYIRRNDMISETKREIYLNFILFTRKVTVHVLEDTLDMDLYEKIKTSHAVVLKSWLLEKVAAILQKK